MKRLTVFTPTYNRGYCLHQLYESLLRQTNQQFEWLIIDDGSVDNTKELVAGWVAEGKIPVRYVYQNNTGKLGAHITAHPLINTELQVCIDSDDFMPDNAVERILALWDEYGYAECAGMIGLDAFKDGKIAGTKLPEGVKECKYSELFTKYKIQGDKKYVFNTAVFNRYLPYPFFADEKFHVISYVFLLIEQQHNFLLFNEVFCTIEYQPDGLTMGLFNQYKKAPKSFAMYRKAKMQYALNYKERFKNAIHYTASSIMAKNGSWFSDSPFKLTTLLAAPFGVALYFYIMKTNKKALMKPAA